MSKALWASCDNIYIHITYISLNCPVSNKILRYIYIALLKFYFNSAGSLNVLHTSRGTPLNAFSNRVSEFNIFSASGSSSTTIRIQIALIQPGYFRYLPLEIGKGANIHRSIGFRILLQRVADTEELLIGEPLMDFIHPVFLISLRANGQRREKRRDFNKTQVAEDNLSE